MCVLSSSTADVAYISIVSQVHVSNLANCFRNNGRKIILHKSVFHLEEENELCLRRRSQRGSCPVSNCKLLIEQSCVYHVKMRAVSF